MTMDETFGGIDSRTAVTDFTYDVLLRQRDRQATSHLDPLQWVEPGHKRAKGSGLPGPVT